MLEIPNLTGTKQGPLPSLCRSRCFAGICYRMYKRHSCTTPRHHASHLAPAGSKRALISFPCRPCTLSVSSAPCFVLGGSFPLAEKRLESWDSWSATAPTPPSGHAPSPSTLTTRLRVAMFRYPPAAALDPQTEMYRPYQQAKPLRRAASRAFDVTVMACF